MIGLWTETKLPILTVSKMSDNITMDPEKQEDSISREDYRDTDVRHQRPITFRRLIELLEMGLEPVNHGKGWTIEVPDPVYSIVQKCPIEDGIIAQVHAYGVAETNVEGGGLTLRYKHQRENRML